MNRIENVKDSTHPNDPRYIAADAVVTAINKVGPGVSAVLVGELRLAFPHILWTLHTTPPYLRIDYP